MRLTFEITREELLAALQASGDSETINVAAQPVKPTTQAVPALSKPVSQPAAAVGAKRGPGRKSNAEKAAEAAAAAAAAAAAQSSTEIEEEDDDLDLNSELADAVDEDIQTPNPKANSDQDDLELGLLEDDEEDETEVEEQNNATIEGDTATRKKIADALQAHKKRHGGKAQGATDILRKFAPSLAVANVKKKDVNALLKALSK